MCLMVGKEDCQGELTVQTALYPLNLLAVPGQMVEVAVVVVAGLSVTPLEMDEAEVALEEKVETA